MEKNSMGKRLQKARKNKGLTQDEAVAALQRIGITTSKSYLSQLERGERNNPSLELLQGLARIYDVRISYLVAPDETLEALSDDEVKYLEELIRNDNLKILLREARGLTPGDLARIVEIARLWNSGRLTGN